MAKKKSQSHAETSTDPMMDLAVAVSNRVQIRHVNLIKCKAWRTQKVNSHGDDFEVELGVKLAFARENDGRELDVFLDFQLQGKDAAGTPSLIIGATYLLNYSLDSPDGLEETNFKAFAEINGVFQGWPFWREFVLNMTGKMGIHPITLPVHRVSSLRKNETSLRKALPPTEGAEKVSGTVF